MITVVIGHRGTGKSELMKRMQDYTEGSAIEFFDLDKEIEARSKKTIEVIFQNDGETYFRDLEKKVFDELIQHPRSNIFIVVGAGFELNLIPEEAHVLWLRRKTDLDGRIFLDRPRLNAGVPPMQEYIERALQRESRFKLRADETYLMPEGSIRGHHAAMAVEKKILTRQVKDVGGIVTVLPEDMATDTRWQKVRNRYINLGIAFFELRDDLLSEQQIQNIFSEIPDHQIILSLRKAISLASISTGGPLHNFWEKAAFVDWAWELGAPIEILGKVPPAKLILSLHERADFTEWSKFESQVGLMKYAPEVDSFNDLQAGHRWQAAHPKVRSFLPRSANGRWEWYRLLQKQNQFLNFWREGGGSAQDQPSLWSWLFSNSPTKKFAAVLGDPLKHSYTPLEHSDFFAKRGIPVFAINIARDEWQEALTLLQTLGLSYAAVTAPHKENAATLMSSNHESAVNTLYWSEEKKRWLGTSTDGIGFVELLGKAKDRFATEEEVVVWGGGGTLEMMQKVLPSAIYFSSRTAQVRKTSQLADLVVPQVLIWAAPRGKETLWPSSNWRPRVVLDLNYKEDSMGREYAQKVGAVYHSGLSMFLAQAQEQRVFWTQCEEAP